jgi:hypothetical protein
MAVDLSIQSCSIQHKGTIAQAICKSTQIFAETVEFKVQMYGDEVGDSEIQNLRSWLLVLLPIWVFFIVEETLKWSQVNRCCCC